VIQKPEQFHGSVGRVRVQLCEDSPWTLWYLLWEA